MVYLISGPRNGKYPIGAREKPNVAGNASKLCYENKKKQLCYELLVWDLKKKKREGNTLLPNSNCFQNGVSETQTPTGLF